MTRVKSRYLYEAINSDLRKKMVFLGGPRQVGKTTLALDLLGSGKTARYYNFDFDADRERISAGQ